MGAVLDEETEIVSESQKRESHNAKNKENYNRLINGDLSDIKEGVSSENKTVKYDSLNAFRPLHERREITFEDVQIPADLMANAETHSMPSSKVQHTENILTSRGYVEAANRMAAQTDSVLAPETADETLSVPTGTTLQYAGGQTATEADVKTVTRTATVSSIKSVAAERSEYYAKLLKKVIAVFAVAAVVLLTIIAVNSAVLRGLDVYLNDLNLALEALKEEVAALEEAVEEETSWESILEFITQAGMLLP